MSSRRSAMFKEEEWARVQPIIRKLYLLEDKSLKDVIIILSTLHNFRPSKAQLESKLRQWHMTKNMTSMEWKHVDMRIRKRRLQGKESKVYLSGIPLRPATVEKARSRHSFESILDRVTRKAPPSPEDLSLIIRTPSPPAEVRTWNTHNIPWIHATDFLREFTLGTLLQTRLSIRFPVEQLLSLVLEDHPKLSCHTSKLQYTMRSLALIMPAAHQEHHVFRAESLLLSPLSASIPSESFELLLFLLSNNFLDPAYSVEDREKQSAVIGLLLDMVQRFRVLDFFRTQPFATLPLSLQSALNRLFKQAVQRQEPDLVRQLLQVGVDVNQYLSLMDCGSIHIIYACRAIEYAVLVYDTALMKILSDFGADSRFENMTMILWALWRRKRHASASERSIVYILSNCNLRPENHQTIDQIDQIDDICREIGSDMACSVSEQTIKFLRVYFRKPTSVLSLLVAAVKSNSMFTLDLLSENRHLLNISNSRGETPLTAAVCLGLRQVINHLLQLGVDLNPPPIRFDENLVFASPFQCAAFIADISGIRQLLDAGADINFCHSSTAIYNLPVSVEVEESVMSHVGTMGCLGKTALQAAILGRNTDVALFLLAGGARLVGGELAMAIRSRQQSIIDAVLTKGASLGDPTGTEYGSVLEAAVLTEDVDLISRIIEANPQAVDEPALSAAIFVARTTSNLTIIHHLMEEYAKKPVINDTWLGTAMNLAAHLDLHEVSELMLTSGLHPTTCCRADLLYPPSPLGRGFPRQIRMPVDYLRWRRIVQQNNAPSLSLINDAVENGQLDYLELLLQHGYRAPEFVETLPRMGANLEFLQTLHRHGSRMTSRLLSDSICGGYGQITQWILSLNMDLAATIPDGFRTTPYLRTPLQAAAELGDTTLFERLRTLGANINDPPARRGGVTALQAASIRGYYGLVKRLLDSQADPNAPGAGFGGRTALEGAAEHGRLDVVQLLLNSGVETCGSGRRPYARAIEYARRSGHHTVSKLLRSHRSWTEADQELLKDETLLRWDQTPEGIAKRREELEGHTAQATDDDETSEYETSEYEDSDYEESDEETSDDEASKDDAEEASLNRLPASTLEETREVLRINDETPGLPGDAIWAEAYENWSSEFPWSME